MILMSILIYLRSTKSMDTIHLLICNNTYFCFSNDETLTAVDSDIRAINDKVVTFFKEGFAEKYCTDLYCPVTEASVTDGQFVYNCPIGMEIKAGQNACGTHSRTRTLPRTHATHTHTLAHLHTRTHSFANLHTRAHTRVRAPTHTHTHNGRQCSYTDVKQSKTML
jgi:hypothetical protein